jgi:hypothetical protein
MREDAQDEEWQQRAEANVDRAKGATPGPLLSPDEQLYQGLYRGLAAPLPPGLPATFAQQVGQRLRGRQGQRARQRGWVGVALCALLALVGLVGPESSFVTETLTGLWHARAWLLPAVLVVGGLQLLDYRLEARTGPKGGRGNHPGELRT